MIMHTIALYPDSIRANLYPVYIHISEVDEEEKELNKRRKKK